jgi:glutamate synthase domain-containing protein 2/glutamate synthase domain-containing protein 1/glutamate synthase domain-containing protein 3
MNQIHVDSSELRKLQQQIRQSGRYGLYEQGFERDSCGVGFVAQLDGIARHTVVADALEVLAHMEHRGAVGADAKTGDGAGIMVQIPDQFFRALTPQIIADTVSNYAVGMVFLPREEESNHRCIEEITIQCEAAGFHMLGWRDVPVDSNILGTFAAETEPVMKQWFITHPELHDHALQRSLYVVRRKIEKAINAWDEAMQDFYICSLSHSVVVYKGMLTGNQVALYFPDLANPLFASAFCIVHSRFSTNTLPQWRLAQPFRFAAHNGEINTIQGNINRQKAREGFMSSALLGEELHAITPIIDDAGSDSAVFDNVLELFTMAGRSIPHVMMMMIPEAYGPEIHMSADKRAFYEYHSILMEPWDGPAAMVFTDGRYVGATLDRNGLRPARYTITTDGLVVLASEAGVLDIPIERVRTKGRLLPGKMFLVDLKHHNIVPDNVIKSKLSRQFPYRRWVKDSRIELRGLFAPSGVPALNTQDLREKQVLFGYTDEDVKTVITPMALQGQEAIGSMGFDTGLAVFTEHRHLLFSYFKQRFAQVTNPPIDPLREQVMMSLESYIENESNPLDIDQRQYRSLKLNHPVLSARDMARIRNNAHEDLRTVDIDITFARDTGTDGMAEAMTRICREAEERALQGISLIILTDRDAGKNRIPVPSLLAVSGLHQYMLKQQMRGRIGIIIETGEVREVFHYALHLAFGCDAICPYIAFATVRELSERGDLGVLSPEVAADNYVNAVKKGLLKTFSRMGISTLHSFFNTQIFEAVGLSDELIRKYFTGTVSRIGGIGLPELTEDTLYRHRCAYPLDGQQPILRDPGGAFRYRKHAELHYWSPEAISLLQMAVQQHDYKKFKEFSAHMDAAYRSHGELRGLITFLDTEAIPIEEVEPVEAITRRFVSAAMSIGSISREAHETVAIAMNRLGAKSNSGEGGEDPARNEMLANGDSLRSRIKQIASGRFGVTTEYIMSADELQIKMAQGAKPGEGGQLPGNKVTEYIAKIRHTVEGVTLISPPPHHDIYSIEDLAQLIFDLRQVNPQAEVSVKLVSEAGVGTIAAGVCKAKADRVLISGMNGGTGASPLTAIRHAGMPWELGLAETQQTLVINGLRDQIIVQVDGHLKTGRDLAIAALLGAEEFGFGTSLLISLGCMMVRKCHLNTCPFGVATQNPELRKLFHGKAEYIVNFLSFVAQELREYMAQLGFRTLQEMVGRVDLLTFISNPERKRTEQVSLDRILASHHVKPGIPLRSSSLHKRESMSKLDQQIDHRLQRFWDQRQVKTVDLAVRNTDRTVGGRLSGIMVSKFGSKGLPDDTLTLQCTGSAGQSFGAFLSPGLTLRLQGEANDYVAKGLSGGTVILLPPDNARFRAERNSICGNVALYGATSGSVFIRGVAGERFAVRNSGATAVVEGLGDHGCEYMTGGVVVVLGATGKNFAAGMSGGIAYVYDPGELFDTRCNLDMVELESLWDQEDRDHLKILLERHAQLTGSRLATSMLDDWEAQYPQFVKVMPVEYRKVLDRMKMNEDRDDETISATEEVYHG